jgi:FeS assembly SUF system regulator
MLRISKIADYGTMVMTQMASQPGRLFSANDLAAALGLGRATVSKVLKSLARSDLVASVRGLHGGYALTRPPQRITVADIVDALEDQPFGLTECSATSGSCDIEPSCHVRANWQKINLIVRRALEGVTLADMVGPSAGAERPVVVHHASARGGQPVRPAP